MMRNILLIFFILLTSAAFSIDKLVRNNGVVTQCDVVKIDSSNVHILYYSGRNVLETFVNLNNISRLYIGEHEYNKSSFSELIGKQFIDSTRAHTIVDKSVNTTDRFIGFYVSPKLGVLDYTKEIGNKFFDSPYGLIGGELGLMLSGGLFSVDYIYFEKGTGFYYPLIYYSQFSLLGGGYSGMNKFRLQY